MLTRTFPVFVDVDNNDQPVPLIPGAFVRATVEGPTYHDGMLVPRGAIREGHVLVATKSVVERRAVSVTRMIGEQALVENGLNAGDRVILSLLDRLEPGAAVRFLEDEGKTETHVNAGAGSHKGGGK